MSSYRLDGPASNLGGSEIFRHLPDRPWGPLKPLYNGYRVTFPKVNRPARSVDHPLQASAKVNASIEL